MSNETHKCGLQLQTWPSGHCRITDSNGFTRFEGDYPACVAWLKARNCW